MNILFVSPDHATESSGVNTVVSQVADHLAGDEFSIIITAVGTSSIPQTPEVEVELIKPHRFFGAWRWSPCLTNKIIKIIQKHDISIIHVHGVWRAANLAGLMAGKRCGIPVVLSSHGMLSPWMWNKQGLLKKIKKKIYLDFVLRRCLPENLCLHAITDEEKKHLQKYFPGKMVVTIANAINMDSKHISIDQFDCKEFDKTILFLGRLHPVKGIELLIEAFHKANLTEPWKLKIAGSTDDLEYVNSLKEMVEKYDLEERVEFLGAVYGEGKLELLSRAWVLVMPSYSEVVGMVNLEAALCNLPSITTHETGLMEWQKGGGELVNPDSEEISVQIQNAMNWSKDERVERGRKAFKHVKNNYSWDVILPAWKKFYSSLLEG